MLLFLLFMSFFFFFWLLRMEKVTMRSTSSQAKMLGTVVSIGGAFVASLYQGPPIIIAPSSNISLHQSLTQKDTKSNWVVGGLLLTAEYILVPLWYIVQVNLYWKILRSVVSSFLIIDLGGLYLGPAVGATMINGWTLPAASNTTTTISHHSHFYQPMQKNHQPSFTFYQPMQKNENYGVYNLDFKRCFLFHIYRHKLWKSTRMNWLWYSSTIFLWVYLLELWVWLWKQIQVLGNWNPVLLWPPFYAR